MKGFKKMIRRTWKNKVLAVVMMVVSAALVVALPQEDAGGSLFIFMLAIPLFLEKHNVVGL